MRYIIALLALVSATLACNPKFGCCISKESPCHKMGDSCWVQCNARVTNGHCNDLGVGAGQLNCDTAWK
ncbi:hypothetical protein CTA2_4137 [Colletotrichum tanaceti]|uniref:Extracellular membrane protein CFEM domain-containing protein n=1 Tax=Colletotrichum tanaceti TaxID=1306861 RepID=A0A4U6XQW6_9PEZI|nr:hypothetical protein CTA2_4137 [Colletotrichum tanaceti]TKW58240.1 hypothetical protein CTA1_7555 [Colletotrichum tanaceti]